MIIVIGRIRYPLSSIYFQCARELLHFPSYYFLSFSVKYSEWNHKELIWWNVQQLTLYHGPGDGKPIFCLTKWSKCWIENINKQHASEYIATTSLFVHRLLPIDCLTPASAQFQSPYNYSYLMRWYCTIFNMNNWMRIVRTHLVHDVHGLNAQCNSTMSANAMTECLVFSQTVAAIDAYYHKWQNLLARFRIGQLIDLVGETWLFKERERSNNRRIMFSSTFISKSGKIYVHKGLHWDVEEREKNKEEGTYPSE